MGQHQVQARILRNFSFPGPQQGSKLVWTLDKDASRPTAKSHLRTGFFRVACSGEVDKFITNEENKHAYLIDKLSDDPTGLPTPQEARQICDWVALQYARAKALDNQIAHILKAEETTSKLAQHQIQKERDRLTSRQDLATFQEITKALSKTLTKMVIRPMVTQSQRQFITSDTIAYVGTNESTRLTALWLPLTPNTGIAAYSKSP